MKKDQINRFIGGWFIGNFSPAISQISEVEVGVKYFQKGDREASHKQNISTEVTVIHSGLVRIGDMKLSQGDVLVIPPGEYADFEALSDGSLTCVKFPSLPDDKVLL
jgi:quercetin dioxygenase-like cupin family protein